MRAEAALAMVVCLVVFSGHAFGQGTLPWLRSEQEKAPEPGEFLNESKLPLVRVRFEGGSAVWVGQAVALNLEVIVPTWFTAAPRFPEMEVRNAVVLSPEGTVNFVVQSGGKTFSAQSRRYLIFPQASGKYTVPPLKVEVSYAEPDGKASTPISPVSAPLEFTAKVPAGAEGAEYFLCASNFKVTQSFDRKLENLKTGDSFIRTISMRAQDTVGIALPPLRFEAPEGVRLYAGTPRIFETAERGKVEATRTEAATYALEKPGAYELPEIMILWWDPQKKKMNKDRLPQIEFEVAEDSNTKPEVFASSIDTATPGPQEPRKSFRGSFKKLLPWLLVLFGGLFFLALIRRILSARGISIASWLSEGKKRRAGAEIVCFKRFRKASLSNDPKAALREIMIWLDCLNSKAEASTLEEFAKGSGMPELVKQASALRASLFSRIAEDGSRDPRNKWSGHGFCALVDKARKAHLRRTQRAKNRTEQMFLLNPSGTGCVETRAGPMK